MRIVGRGPPHQTYSCSDPIESFHAHCERDPAPRFWETVMSRPRPKLNVRLNVQPLEQRILPASPVILLNNFGNQGATLRGFEDNARAGRSVAGAGDVNGDGFADFIVGAHFTNAGGTSRGEAYVVFGGPNLGGTIPILSNLGTGGFTIRGFEDSALAGRSVS